MSKPRPNNKPRTARELHEAIIADGGIELPGKKHRKYLAPNGRMVVCAATPSDWRSVMNTWSQWKRTSRMGPVDED